jgi:hypothetical protein
MPQVPDLDARRGCAPRCWMAADARLLWWADLGVYMSDEYDTLGVEATEVRPDSAGRNVLIAVIGLVLAVAALIPLTWGAIWIGSIVYAGVVAFFTGGASAPEVSPA